MKKKYNYSIWIFNVIYLLLIILTFNGLLSFGHGLGDIYYILQMLVILLLNSVTLIKSNNVIKKIFLLLNLIIIMYFLINLTINRGSEQPWNGKLFISFTSDEIDHPTNPYH